MHLALAPGFVASARVSDAVLAGVRDRLAEAGAFEGGPGYPRVEVEVLRVDETSEGIAARGGLPVARGLRLAVLGRARLIRAPGEPPSLDTADVRASVIIGSEGEPRGAMLAREEALRGAALGLGRRLADRLLGVPSASDEGDGPDF